MGVGASKLTDTWFGGASGHPCCSSAYCFEPYDLDAPPTDESGSSAAGKTIEEYGSPRLPLLQSPRSTQNRGAAKGPAYAPGSPAMVGLPEFRSAEARRLYFDWRNLATNAALHGLPAVMRAKSAYEQANQVGRKSTEDALSSLATLSALSRDAETTANPKDAGGGGGGGGGSTEDTGKDEDEEEDEVRAGLHAEPGDKAGESEEDDDDAVEAVGEEAGGGGGAKGELGSLDRLGRRGMGPGLGKR